MALYTSAMNRFSCCSAGRRATRWCSRTCDCRSRTARSANRGYGGARRGTERPAACSVVPRWRLAACRPQSALLAMRPQSQAAAPQCPSFALRPQSEAIFEGPQAQASSPGRPSSIPPPAASGPAEPAPERPEPVHSKAGAPAGASLRLTDRLSALDLTRRRHLLRYGIERGVNSVQD